MGTCVSISTKPEKASNASKFSSCMGVTKKFMSISSLCLVGERRTRRDNFASLKLEEEVVHPFGSTTSTPVLPLWQRRILMGEKCELPRFSGLILYDEHGFPLRSDYSTRGTPQKLCYAAKTWFGGFVGIVIFGASALSRTPLTPPLLPKSLQLAGLVRRYNRRWSRIHTRGRSEGLSAEEESK